MKNQTLKMLATCKDMKKDVNNMESLSNYSIKKKHAKNLNCFFNSKNFELRTEIRPATPPEQEKPKAKSGNDRNSQMKKKQDDSNLDSRPSSREKGPHMLIYSDNIEDDIQEHYY